MYSLNQEYQNAIGMIYTMAPKVFFNNLLQKYKYKNIKILSNIWQANKSCVALHSVTFHVRVLEFFCGH